MTRLTIEELNSKIVFAIRDKWSDNDGAYHIAYFLSNDKKKIYTQTYSDGYNNIPYDAVKINASEADIKIARQIYIDTLLSVEDSETYIGCTVKLRRSKKAPNNVELVVSSETKSNGYNRFNIKTPNTIDLVDYNTEPKTIYPGIAESCIYKVVKGATPLWF